MHHEINKAITFSTDTATLSVFDPECLKHRLNTACDWWCGSFAGLEEVANGRVAFISVAADGVFKVRITSGDLASNERDYATERLGPLGLEVKSGKVFVGPGERITGGGFAPDAARLRDGEGTIVDIPPGKYDLLVYSVEWFESPRWWNSDGTRPDDTPPDFVVVLSPRTSDFKRLTNEPRISGVGSTFLFASTTRQVGPALGLVFTTEVWKNPAGLTLKAGGPGSYKPLLQDFSGLTWRDKVSVRVLSIDHQAQTTSVELVKKLSP